MIPSLSFTMDILSLVDLPEAIRLRINAAHLLVEAPRGMEVRAFFWKGGSGLHFKIYTRPEQGLAAPVDYMTSTDLISCREKLGTANPLVRGVNFTGQLQLAFGENAQELLPSPDTLAYISQAIVERRALPLMPKRVINVSVLLGLMNIQPAIGDHYTDYCIVPDPGVRIAAPVPEAGADAFIRGLEFPAEVPAANHFTQNEVKILYGLVMILLNKTIGSDHQYNQVIESRLSSLRAHLRAFDFPDPADVKQLLPQEVIQAISNTLSMFPKLKFTLFSVVLKDVDNGINDHIRLLLRDSQLTIFTCIYEFLRSPIKTMAHICPPVVQQALSWHAVFTYLEETYGDLWHYFKLFEPNSARTAQANWLVLSCAAWMFSVVVAGKMGMTNVKANRASMTYLKTKLAQKIPPGFLIEEEAAVAQEINAALRQFMGIRENYRDIVPEDIDEATLDAAEVMMAEIRGARR